MRTNMPELKKFMDRKLSLQLNGNRKVIGTLRGYDAFLNIVLDECVQDGMELGMVVIRGNSVVAIEALKKI